MHIGFHVVRLKKLTGFIVLLLLGHTVSGSLYAQEKTITGKVSSTEGEVLSLANVVLLDLPDSSHIAYAITDNNGNYILHYEGTGDAVLQVSYIGYVTQQQVLSMDKTDQIVNFELDISIEMFSKAVINARMLGARVKGDTISYNIRAYTDSTERILKDILEKLPGIEVDESGKVKAQGKPVKVLIDNKEFFLDQSQMATKNIPANMVESVDLINNYTDIGMLGSDSQPQGISVLNIGIKESYKGRISGNFTAGAGPVLKYSGKINLFNISKNLSIATLFDANNTGEMAFTLSDYVQFQGISRLFRNSGGNNRVTLDALDVPISSFSDDVARKEGQTGAFNLSYRHPNDKLKINTYTIANHQEQRGEMVSRNWRSIGQDSNPVSVDALAEQGRFSFINTYLGIDYQPTKQFFISNRSMVTGQMRNSINLVSRQIDELSNSLTTNEKVTTLDFKNSLLSMYKTENGSILTFDGYYRYNDRPGTLSLLSDNPFLGLSFSSVGAEYSAIQEIRQTVHEASFLLDYSHRLGNFFIKPQIGASYMQQYLNPALFQSVNDVKILFTPEQDYANTVRYNNSNLWAGLWLQRNIGILRLAVGADIHHFTTGLHDKNRKPLVKNEQWKLLPNAQFTVYLAANQNISISVNIVEEVRKIAELTESKAIRDYKTITQGKATDDLLNPVFNASLRYFYSNFQKGTTIIFSSSYSKHSHPLTYNYTYYPGYSESTIVESPDNSRITSMFRLRQSLGRLPIDIELIVNYNSSSFTSYINGAENNIIQDRFTTNLKMMTFRRGILNGDFGGELIWSNNLSKLTNKTMRLLTLVPYASLRINAGKGLTMRTSIHHYNYNGNDVRMDITNLSASVVYIPPKGSFEFELIANNILNFRKTEKVTNTYSNGLFIERIIQTLPGFLMIKILYRI